MAMYFMGVFPSDKLPRFISRPALLVCNTDASHLPGLHWIAIFVDYDGRGEFYGFIRERTRGTIFEFYE